MKRIADQVSGIATSIALAAFWCLAAPSYMAAQDHEPTEEQHAEEGAHHDAVSTSRPGLIRRPNILAAGRFQFESGYNLANAPEETQHTVGELLLRIGINGWSEIIVDVGSFVSLSEHGHRESGLADARLGYKVRLVDVNVSRWIPLLALSGGTSIPIGAEAFGSSSLQPFADVGAHWSLSDRFGVVTSVSIENLDEGERFIAATSAELTLTEVVHAHIEYARIQPLLDGAHGADDVSAGLGYHVTEDVAVDARLGLARHSGVKEFFFGFGFSRRW